MSMPHNSQHKSESDILQAVLQKAQKNLEQYENESDTETMQGIEKLIKASS